MAQTASVPREARTIVKQVDSQGLVTADRAAVPGPGAILYSDGTILIREVRASYPHILSPYVGKNKDGTPQTGKFGLVALMPKTKPYFPSMNVVRDEINRIMLEHKVPKNKEGKFVFKADLKFLRDGNTAGKEEYEDHFTISASETRRPQARDIARDPKTKKPRVLVPGVDDDVIYAGCWVHILIRPWWQDSAEWGKRVNAGLTAIQFCRDDEPFGESRITPEDVDNTFDDFSEEGSGYDDELGQGEDTDEL
jgi:hypothetical protein